jgi:Uncharacterised nucleotidyltransferase
MWDAVQALADDRADPRALRLHRLQLVAARRARLAGRRPPPELVSDEHRAATVALAAPVLLRRIRASSDGPLLTMKGPEAALSWPDPALRPYVDLDLLTTDSCALQRALVGVGFEPVADHAGPPRPHHLRPLHWPRLPLTVEVHHQPNWPRSLGDPPSAAELLAAARPSGLGVEGLLAPDPSHHALLLAAHAWVHTPLRRLGDLVDIAAFAISGDARVLELTARRWGLARLWRATARAVEDLLGGGRRSLALRTWARHLPAVRERTVLEAHAARWLAPAWGSPPCRVARATLAAACESLGPEDGERWAAKLARTRRALRDATVAESLHAPAPTTDHPERRSP